MNKIIAVIQREYISRVRTKGFLIGTLLMPLFIIFVTIAPAAFMAMKSEKASHIAVVDLTDDVFAELELILDEQNGAGERVYQFHRISADSGSLAEVKRNLRIQTDEGFYKSYIIIPANVYENSAIEYYSTNVTNFRENSEIESGLSRVITRLRLERSGLFPAEVNELMQSIQLNTFKIGPGGKEERDIGLSFGVTYIMIFVLYLALILYGTMTMRSVVEDKNNRVIEVILSTVKPFQLMAGKILGVGAVGLTQFFIWAGVAGIVSLYSSSMIQTFLPDSGNIPPPSIPPSQLIYFVLFFILGYFFYATIYAAIGAMVNSDQEAQQFQWPVMSFLILAFMLVFYAMGNPDSTVSVLFSLLPMFSPILMFMRVSVHSPPAWQIATSILLLLLSVWSMMWLVGRIFRVGILMYGKRPTVPEIFKWIKYG